MCPPLDGRGKHSRHVKVPESIRKQIDEHIRSFPVMKSHYSRAKHNKRCKYLSPLLNVAEMHNLYFKKYEPDAAKPIVSYSYYLKYFSENFNMSFGYPRAVPVMLSILRSRQLGMRRRSLCNHRRKIISGKLRTSTQVCEPTHCNCDIRLSTESAIASYPCRRSLLHAPTLALSIWCA